MTTMYDKKRENVLQFSAKKFWGIFCLEKTAKKKCKAKPVCITFYTNTDRDDN